MKTLLSAMVVLLSFVATTTRAQIPQFAHVFIVVEENAGSNSVIGSSSMPYLNGLATQYSMATQYYANTHPSIGNYLGLTTGQILTNDDGQTPTSFPVSVDNVVRDLIAAGKTWKQYAESIPSVGYIGGNSTCCGGAFYTRHAPLPYMTDAQTAAQKVNIVPFTQFATDLAANTLPHYAFITPNGCDDAHDCALATADTWLKTNIDPLIQSPAFQNSLLLIVFDESEGDNTNGGGKVALVLVSPLARHGYQSTTLYQEQSLCRLTMEAIGATPPAACVSAPSMAEFFEVRPAPPTGLQAVAQ